MNFLQQKSSGGTQVSGLLAHVTVVKVWGSGVSSASGMLNMCLTCQLLWMTVNAWLPQWYSYFFYPSHSSTNSTTSLWPRRYQLGSKVKKDTYIYLDFIWWAHFYGSLRGKKAVIWEHVRVSSPITRRDICQSGQLCWSVYHPWLQQVDWHLPVIWCTNGVLPSHSPPFRTLSIDRKIGVSQSICQGCMLCFSLSGLWQNSLCAGGLKIQTMALCMSCWRDTSSGLPLALGLRHVHGTAVCINTWSHFPAGRNYMVQNNNSWVSQD